METSFDKVIIKMNSFSCIWETLFTLQEKVGPQIQIRKWSLYEPTLQREKKRE